MEIIVKIGEMKVSRDPDVLITRALGSCVAVCLYDASTHMGGMCHIILPNSVIAQAKNFNPAKFADTGIQLMLNQLADKIGSMRKVEAKVIGGASMFSTLTENLNIGAKNVDAVTSTLAKLKIPIIADDTGDDYGRNVKFYLKDGTVEVSSFRKDTIII